MENIIMNILDEALAKSCNEPQNVIITGETGIGKTFLVEEWFKSHPEVRPFYFFANTRPRAYNKVREADGTVTKLDFEIYFGTDECDKMNTEDTVLLIDHFDLTHSSARKHLTRLVENREVMYNLNGDVKRLGNLKMIIAVAFPLGESYFGYNPLSEEDIEVFDYKIECK